MKLSPPPRWRAPAILIVVATVALVIVGTVHGWDNVVYWLPIPTAVGIWLYVNAGLDTDYGATLRFERDERQKMGWLKAQALTGRLLSIGVIVGYVVALVTKMPIWPWMILVAVMAVSLLSGMLYYSQAGGQPDEEATSRP